MDAEFTDKEIFDYVLKQGGVTQNEAAIHFGVSIHAIGWRFKKLVSYEMLEVAGKNESGRKIYRAVD